MRLEGARAVSSLGWRRGKTRLGGRMTGKPKPSLWWLALAPLLFVFGAGGYQGWFPAKGDGYEPGFVHWGAMDRTPTRCSVDFWPDMSELGPDERFPANYRHADGSTACVFNSAVRKTVLRHYKWMRDYGIDGARHAT